MLADPDERREFLAALGPRRDRPRPHHRRRLFAAGPDHVPDRRTEGVAGLDHHARHQGAASGRRIHSDFEKGFIRAETIAYADFVACGGEQGAKDAGKMRLEGAEYVVQDGDVMHFRFNV